MAEITYLDFDLLIERSEGGYRARVVHSPGGQADARFAPPFSELELENLILRVGHTRRRVRRLESPEMEAAKTLGGRLYEAVFSEEMRDCLRSSLDQANQHGAGLRIRLRLADVPELIGLPWEYLYNPAVNRFFSLSVETPLVRYLDLPGRIRPLEVATPLRMLVMVSSPSDYPSLDVEGEWKHLQEALGDLEERGLVAVERLEEATLRALQRRLRREAFHIFHFIGHGGYDQQAQDGVLLLKDAEGRGHAVSGQQLGALLYDERTLRLAVLNACESGQSARTDPFAGVAQSLVQQGIPAVIAMQFEITDEAATTLAHDFYGALADGYPVDAALAEARKAVYALGNDVEWGTPVLYMRSPDGRVFDVGLLGEEERRQAEVAVLYRQAETALARGNWERAIEKLQAILNIDPTCPKATERLRQAQLQRDLASKGKAAPAGAARMLGWLGSLPRRMLWVVLVAVLVPFLAYAGYTFIRAATLTSSESFSAIVQVWDVVLDRKNVVIASREFARTTEQEIADWVTEQIEDIYALDAGSIEVYVRVPADLSKEEIDIQTTSPAPVRAHFWIVEQDDKVRVPLEEDMLAHLGRDFVLEVGAPGYSTRTLGAVWGQALEESFTLEPRPIKIGIEEFTGEENTLATGLANRLASDPRFAVHDEGASGALQTRVAEHATAVARNPEIQVGLRIALGVDLVISGHYDVSQTR